MKILHLYSGNLYGGVETFLVTLARCRDLCPELIPEFGLCFRGRLSDELTTAGAVVHNMGEVRLSRPWSVWKARQRLRKLLNEKKFDAVATHACWPHAVFASEVRNRKIPLVHFVHDVITSLSRIDKHAARTAPDLIIANSACSASHCKTLFSRSTVNIVHLPLARRTQMEPFNVRDNVRAELGTDLTSVVMIQVGRLERLKGVDKLLQSLIAFRDDKSWTAWIVGGIQRESEKPFLKELMDLVEQGGIRDRVRFLGSRDDVGRLMRAADIYCQANTGPESFGLTYIEAMHAGLPVVASDLGGPAEIVDSTCGIKVKAGDEAALVQALRELIHDPVRRKELGTQGPPRASQLCDPARQLRRQFEAIASVCSPRHNEF